MYRGVLYSNLIATKTRNICIFFVQNMVLLYSYVITSSRSRDFLIRNKFECDNNLSLIDILNLINLRVKKILSRDFKQ
jgi:hypothetical protein